MNRRDNNNLLNRSFPTNRGNVNMNKEVKEKVAGSSPTNLEILNIDKETNVTGNPPTNRGNVNREKDKKINKI